MGDDMRCQLQPHQASQSKLLLEPQVLPPLLAGQACPVLAILPCSRVSRLWKLADAAAGVQIQLGQSGGGG